MIVTGGKSVYGASIGILMLEAQFPRIPGDMGNALTWPFPVLYKVVKGATPDQVVRNQAQGLLDQFINASRELVEAGVDGITTNCGFLALFQKELSSAIQVPVASSSLMQVPLVDQILPAGKRCGVLTISDATLTDQHLELAGCALDTPIGGTPKDGEFTRVILDNEFELDVNKAKKENVNAALDLVGNHPDIGAILLECTNMIPYASDIQQATGLPVFSIYNFIIWFQAALRPRESF